ncbi:DUF5592 family protein [Listeria innocua]|uniref:DUF5592 family protein n=1 Tax=Listeria innocua TaxID=1642 RepID=UPI0016296A77|nr:DUF5592 family protein [Listeria innocua]MBC1925563.1 hypothetical protein [Listeria innocua]
MFERPTHLVDKATGFGTYSFQDLIALIVLLVIGFQFLAELIYPPLKTLFSFVYVVLVLFWFLPSRTRPHAKNFEVAVALLKRRNEIYCHENIEKTREEND